MPWFYQNIEEAVQFNDNIPPDGLAPKKYLKKHNQYWLKVRGLDDSGSAELLRDRVAEYMALPNPPQALPELDLPAEAIQEAVVSLLAMVQCIMSKTTTPAVINETRHAIRLFLSKFDALCEPLAPNSSVVSSYNFMCLMNIPEAMELFGPLRNLYEGGPRGEGFALFAKPHMSGVMKKSWHYHLMRELLREKAFNSMLPQERKVKVPVTYLDALRHRSDMFQKYDAEYTFGYHFVQEFARDKKPVSVLLVEMLGGEIVIFGVVGSYDSVLKVEISDVPAAKVFGFYYYEFGLPATQSVQWESVASSVTAIGYGLLLPLLEDKQSKRFALISSNWENLTPSTHLSELIDK